MPAATPAKPKSSVDLQALVSSPSLAGATAILVALLLTWIAALIATVQHFPGIGGRARVLRFFAPGQVLWALALLLGVALLVLAGRRVSSGESGGPGSAGSVSATPGAKPRDLVSLLLTVFFFAACAVGAASLVNAIVELTFAGDSINAAFNGFLQDLAALPIAAGAALWALHAKPSLTPAGGSPT